MPLMLSYHAYHVVLPCLPGCLTMPLMLSYHASHAVLPCLSCCLTMPLMLSYHASQVVLPCFSCCLTMPPRLSYHASHVVLPCLSCCLTMPIMLSYHASHVVLPCLSCCLTMPIMLSYHASQVVLPCLSCYLTMPLMLSYHASHAVLPCLSCCLTMPLMLSYHASQVGHKKDETEDICTASLLEGSICVLFKVLLDFALKPNGKDTILIQRYCMLITMVTWAPWHLKSLTTRLFVQRLVQAIKERKYARSAIVALWEGNLPKISGFPSQRDSNSENLVMSWRHGRYKTVTLRLGPGLKSID